jgi:hypothetical protein
MLTILAGREGEKLALRGHAPGWRRRRSANELRAFHESAHGVASWHCGRRIYGLSIVPNLAWQVGKEGEGCVSGGVCWTAPQDDHQPAGPIVIESDRERAARLAIALAAGCRPRWKAALQVIRNVRAQCVAVLQQHRLVLQTLAAQLEAARSMDETQLDAFAARYWKGDARQQ